MTPGEDAELNELMGFVEGTSWSGLDEIIIDIEQDDGSFLPPTNAAQSCQMVFWKGAGSSPAAIISNGNGITINSAANWNFTIPEQNLKLAAGTWQWYFRVTDVTGITLDWMKGTIPVQSP